ncbi:hypothetical protein ES703_08206 [subsurface metagenome]
MNVPCQEIKIRYWDCPNCGRHNKTIMQKYYDLPICGFCRKDFTWGRVDY